MTGPTGAGKSTVAKLLQQKGFPCIDADTVARDVLEHHTPTVTALQNAFGSDIVKDGKVCRQTLAKRAFAEKGSTALLNRITHPAIVAKMDEMADAFAEQGVKAVILDAPLLFQAGLHTTCYQTVAVLADPTKRLARIMARDQLSQQDALLRMGAGETDAFYLERADIIVYNNDDPIFLEQQVTALAEQINGWCV